MSFVDSSYPLNSSEELTNDAREAWHVFGIMSEFVEATERLAGIGPAVTIFGSARIPRESPYYQLTVEIAEKLANSGFAVLSGGGPGIMEAANRGAFAGKSPSIGLNIELPHEQKANQYQNISLRFRHFFTRKYMFVKMASAYVVMPGGFGTLDELMEALVLMQTGKSIKIPIILAVSRFWKNLYLWLQETLVGEGMINVDDLNLLQMMDDPQQIVDTIYCHQKERSIAMSPEEQSRMNNLCRVY